MFLCATPSPSQPQKYQALLKPLLAPSAPLTTAGLETGGCAVGEARSWAPVSHVPGQPSVLMPTCAQQPCRQNRGHPAGHPAPHGADWQANLPGVRTNKPKFSLWPCPLPVPPKCKP